jgi:Tfp pilus assembly protein PilE
MGLSMNSKGFTAVELLIILVVLTIVFTSFSSSFSTIQTINKQASDVAVANQLAFAKVQQYENEPYSSLPATSPSGTLVQVEDFSSSLPAALQAPRTGLVYINSVSATLKQVVVKVQYGAAPHQHLLEYADFIQKNGI